MSPVLGPDIYHSNVDLVPAARIAEDPRFGFCILKATEGTEYSWAERWFPQNWKAVGKTSLIRGAYHFMIVSHSGKEQAEFYLQTIEANGGFRDVDMHPIFDLEWKLNDGATKEQVLDCAGEFVEKVNQEGHRVIRYARSMLRDLGITSDMGCNFAWCARYNDELGPTDDIGFSQADLWQYTDGKDNFTTNPKSAPGIGPGDMNVLLTDLDRLTIGGSAPVVAMERDDDEVLTPPAHRPSPASWTEADWEAIDLHIGRPSEDEQRVREFALGQMDRRFRRPEPADAGPRRAGWRHEDDLIAIRKSLPD